jgi:hypothetical protein
VDGVGVALGFLMFREGVVDAGGGGVAALAPADEDDQVTGGHSEDPALFRMR